MKDVASSAWPRKPLGELCRIELGSTPARNNASFWDDKRQTDNVWLSIADLPQTLHGVANDSKEYVSDLATQRMRLIPKGTLLVSFKLTLGRLAYAGRDLFSNEAIASLLDIDERVISRPFLYWALTAFDWGKAAEGDQKIKGKTLNKAKLKLTPIPLPPLEEQQRIVAVLDEAFEGLARARTHAEANLQNARELYGRCRDGLLEYGNGWEELQLGDLLENITYGFTNPMPNADDGPFKITAKNVTGGRIDYDNARRTTVQAFTELLTDKSRPKIGDVLLTKDGTLGRTAVVDQDNICINQSVAVMRVNSRILPDYLAELLACSVHQEAMIAGAGGTTIKHLYITRVPKITVAIPEISEQIKLLEALAALRSRCGAVEDAAMVRIQDLDDLRQSLLQKAFAGELT